MHVGHRPILPQIDSPTNGGNHYSRIGDRLSWPSLSSRTQMRSPLIPIVGGAIALTSALKRLISLSY